jgi:DNA-binding SARP family transcriptional activator
VLGPLELVDDRGQQVSLRPKERALLARLVASRDGAVSDDELLNALWAHPPESARKTMHGLVHHVRQAVGGTAITREVSGYRLQRAQLSVDVDDVRSAVLIARQHVGEGQAAEARSLLRSARARFRGPALPELIDDLSVTGLRRQIVELEQDLTEDLLELKLECGDNGETVGEIELLVAGDPTRERAWCLLISALAAAGRHADALHAVALARRALAMELGIEPGPTLRELELAVLEHRVVPPLSRGHDRSATTTRAMRDVPGPLASRAEDVPLVGRGVEIGQLEHRHRAANRDMRPGLDIIIGEAGVGKSRLAAEFARSCHAQGSLVLFGRCSEGVRTAFEPFEQAFNSLLNAPGSTTAKPEVLNQLGSLVARLSPTTGSGPQPAASTPAADRHRLFEDMVAILDALARDSPVLIVLDDLHWASEPTIVFLTHLLRRSANTRVFVIATARVPEFGGTRCRWNPRIRGWRPGSPLERPVGRRRT